MSIMIRVPWSRELDNDTEWNELCAQVVEKFGLPGHKFMATANVNYMDFTFFDSKDGLLAMMHLSSLSSGVRIITEQDLAVELAASKLF